MLKPHIHISSQHSAALEPEFLLNGSHVAMETDSATHPTILSVALFLASDEQAFLFFLCFFFFKTLIATKRCQAALGGRNYLYVFFHSHVKRT